MTPEMIYMGLALALALALDLVPGLKEAWETLPKEKKRWMWFIGSVGLPLVLWVVACFLGWDLFSFGWVCEPSGLIDAFSLGFAAYWLSQGGHAIAKATGRAY